MPIRRRAWMTREGWYYSTVLGFIIGGASLRSVNLLVILAGMMIAMLLFNWRLVMAGLTGLIVVRNLPQRVIAGEWLTVEISIRNTRRWMSAWLLTVDDWIERASHPHGQKLLPTQRTHAAAIISHVLPGGRTTGTYRITLHRRGRYRFGPLRVSTSFPLGLVRGQMTLPASDELIVAPRLGRLLPQWAHFLEAELAGDHRRHPLRGISDGDYYGLRPWQSGDSLRWVHWRTTARLGRPVVRQFERRRSRDVALVLDPWLPAVPSEEDEGLVELAISLAATAVADITGRGQSRLTLAIAGREPQCFTAPASAMYCEELLGRLAEVSPGNTYPLSSTLQRAIEEAPRGTQLIVVSSRDANDSSLADSSSELPIEPEELLWIDTGSEQLSTLFSFD